MALEFERDSIDGLDEGIKGLYVEHEGKYRLDVTGIDPADEVKEALRKERKDRMRANEKLTAYEQERENERLAAIEKEKELLAKNGEYQKLLELEQSERQKEREEREKLSTKYANKERETDAFDAVGGIALNDSTRRHLLNDFKQYARFDGDKMVYESNGVEMTREQVIERVKADNPDLVRGPVPSGSGARPSNASGGAVSSNPWKKGQVNLTEQARILREDATLANRLKKEAK